MIGKTVCYSHGGKSLIGQTSGTFRTGRYSKYLPTRLAAKYEAAQADPDLLALREEVTLIDARLSELVERVDTGESEALWQTLQGVYAQLELTLQARDVAKMATLIRRMGELIKAGSEDNEAWQDIFGAVEQRRKLVESERKRLVEMQSMISSERAMLLISALVNIIRTHVRDRDAMAAITADIGKLITIEAN